MQIILRFTARSVQRSAFSRSAFSRLYRPVSLQPRELVLWGRALSPCGVRRRETAVKAVERCRAVIGLNPLTPPPAGASSTSSRPCSRRAVASAALNVVVEAPEDNRTNLALSRFRTHRSEEFAQPGRDRPGGRSTSRHVLEGGVQFCFLADSMTSIYSVFSSHACTPISPQSHYA